MASPLAPATAASDKKVNKAFFDVISNSHDIGRTLFFKKNAATVHDKKEEYLWRTTDGSETVYPFINPFFKVKRLGFLDPKGVERGLKGRYSMLFTVSTDPIQSFACWRQLPDVIDKTDSHDKMFLTHPPIGEVALEGAYDRSSVVMGSEVGTTYGDLLKYGSVHWPDKFLAELQKLKQGQIKNIEIWPAIYEFQACVTWDRLVRDVDTITGHEMLHILNTDMAKLKELGEELHGGRDDPESDGDNGDDEDDADGEPCAAQ